MPKIALASDLAPSALPQVAQKQVVSLTPDIPRFDVVPTVQQSIPPAMLPAASSSPYAAGLPGVLQWMAHVYPEMYAQLKVQRPDLIQAVAQIAKATSDAKAAQAAAAQAGTPAPAALPCCGGGSLAGLGFDWSSVSSTISSVGNDLASWAGQAAQIYGAIKGATAGVQQQVQQQVQTASNGGQPAPLPNAATGQYPTTRPPSTSSVLGGMSGTTIALMIGGALLLANFVL